ncbi:MAG: Rieske 2Fe-2S domain-containing protein [Anaerolineae bacterium]|nr:Rieske 2Fe-2S domain-containing protein [Anaerolineae bacterium]
MAEATASSNSGLTRREFLYYVWGASMALFTAEFTGLFVWFALPRFKEGEFGGKFAVPVDQVPAKNARPVGFSQGRFWLVNLDTTESNDRMYRATDEPNDIVGVLAVYKVCTHLGCIYDWIEANERFECPCHGSKYRLDGRRIEDPAPRTLDRFSIEAVDADGALLATSQTDSRTNEYAPMVLPANTAQLLINTGDRRQGSNPTLLRQLARAT